jgi:hypothetical protein
MLRSYTPIGPHIYQRERIGFYLWSKGQSSIPTKQDESKSNIFSSRLNLSTHASLLSVLRGSHSTTTHQTLGPW